MSESIENESHLRGVIEQLQTRNRAFEREARNGRAIIGSLKAAMREDSEHFFEQEKEIRSLQLTLGEAAAEINCSGPVSHRIRVLKTHHGEQIQTLLDRIERMEAVVACASILISVTGNLKPGGIPPHEWESFRSAVKSLEKARQD